MAAAYTVEQIEHWRERVHRRVRRPRVTSVDGAMDFVSEVGFCFVFRAIDTALPSLWNAVRHNGGGNGDYRHRAADAAGSLYDIAEMLPAHQDVFYAKLLSHRPTMVSLEYLPLFFAISGRNGEKNEYMKVALQGRLSPMARSIMDQLVKKSPQSTTSLRQAAGVTPHRGAGTFELALSELQRGLYVARVHEGGHPFSSVWAPVSDLYALQVRKARRISADAARHVVLERYFRNQLIGTVGTIRRLFRWEKQDVYRSLGDLMRRGVLTADIRVEGTHERAYALIT